MSKDPSEGTRPTESATDRQRAEESLRRIEWLPTREGPSRGGSDSHTCLHPGGDLAPLDTAPSIHFGCGDPRPGMGN
jgi:hypothetical protein